MTQSISVRIGDRAFASMNQARLCYINILHRYPVGASLIEEDRQYVVQLLSEQQIRYTAPIQQVRVVRAQFGRSCFEVGSTKDNKQKISIVKSIRQKALASTPPFER